MAKEQQQQASSSTQPLQGVVGVTYDAGRHSIALTQDPVEPAKVDGTPEVKVKWTLSLRNGNPNYDVRFGNIVLCNHNDKEVFTRGTLTPTPGDKVWWWKYTPKDPDASQVAVLYDIFVIYYHKVKEDARSLSLRQSLGLDPTLLTPPGG